MTKTEFRDRIRARLAEQVGMQAKPDRVLSQGMFVR